MQRSKVIKVRFEKARAKNKPRLVKTDKKAKTGLKPGKVFLYALGVAALGGGAYLAYDRLRKNTSFKLLASKSDPDTIIINNNLPASVTSSASALRKDNFPLKQGSRGARVTQLQQALASIIGIEAMNANGGIDGIFGPGTANALKMVGYSGNIDEATFNKIISRNTSEETFFNPQGIANSLYAAAESKNLSGVLSYLSQIRSVSDYTSVNTYYKQKGLISKTIVTDLLDIAFKGNESAKQEIRNEFLRIGLKVDGEGRWSLSGFGYRDLITIRETLVTDNQNNKIPVHRNTILGNEVKIENGYTWFRSVDNSILSVPTQDVKYT